MLTYMIMNFILPQMVRTANNQTRYNTESSEPQRYNNTIKKKTATTVRDSNEIRTKIN